MITNREIIDLYYFLAAATPNRSALMSAWGLLQPFLIRAETPMPLPLCEMRAVRLIHVNDTIRVMLQSPSHLGFAYQTLARHQVQSGDKVGWIVEQSFDKAIAKEYQDVRRCLGPGITFDLLEIMIRRYVTNELAEREPDSDMGTNVREGLAAALIIALGHAILGDIEKFNTWAPVVNLWWRCRPWGFSKPEGNVFVVITA